jgi:hypothetical protein
MADVVCSSDLLVAVGFGVMTSRDGTTWTTAAVPHDWRLTSVAWAGSQFVAAGHVLPPPEDSGLRSFLALSPDGVRWTAHAVQFEPDLASSPSVMVGVHGGSIHTSTDGAAWTRSASPVPDGVLTRVIWADTRFVAVGQVRDPREVHPKRTFLLASPDGVNWTEWNLPRSRVNAVAWSGRRFVAVGNTILTSEDGASWARQDPPVEEFDLTDVVWSGSQFAAVGQIATGGGMAGLVLTSPDGLAWTRRSAPSRGVEPSAVAWCRDRFVAVGALRRGWFADYTTDLILTSP